MSESTPVLVVGAGPVGLALAGDLGWRGIPCILVERSDGTVTQPKMDLVGVRTMEFCRRWGIAPWVEYGPYPRDYPQDYVWCTSLTGYEFGREPFPPRGEEPLPPQSPQKRERFPQDMFDPVLTRWVRRFPTTQLRYETELVDLAQDEGGVDAVVRGPGGHTSTVRAGYVVGCDGASSSVRELVGIGMSGNPALTYTTNVIFRCPDLVELHDKGRAYRFIFIGPEGTYATLVAINGADRWRFSIVGGPEERTLTIDEIHAAIRRAVGVDFDYEILSVVPWVRRELVADRYGVGRVFIAGDAAHLMSPTGGFGMNTGIGDSVDLGWKIAAAVTGWAGPGLLASYEAERRPVAIRNVSEATGNLRRMLNPRDERPAPEAFLPGPEGDRARAEFGQRFTEMMRREWFTIGIHLGYRYDDSPVIWPDGTEPPPLEVMTYTQTARPGARAPHVWLDPSHSTLDLYGRAFVLLRLGAGAPSADPLLDAARGRGVPIECVTLDHPEVLDVYARRLVLVRPDGHVAWRADELPADCGELVDVVRGARAAPPGIRTQEVAT